MTESRSLLLAVSGSPEGCERIDASINSRAVIETSPTRATSSRGRGITVTPAGCSRNRVAAIHPSAPVPSAHARKGRRRRNEYPILLMAAGHLALAGVGAHDPQLRAVWGASKLPYRKTRERLRPVAEGVGWLKEIPTKEN